MSVLVNDKKKSKPQESYRVRHVATGLYIGGYTLSDEALGIVHTVEMQLINRSGAWAHCRATAEKVANMWIALTGDHGVEIEPASDQGKE